MDQEVPLAVSDISLMTLHVKKFTPRTVTYPGVPGMNRNFPPLAEIAEGAYTGWEWIVKKRIINCDCAYNSREFLLGRIRVRNSSNYVPMSYIRIPRIVSLTMPNL